MKKLEHVFHAITLAGYFGMMILIISWNAWISPSEQFPKSLVLLILLTPLLFALKGLLHRKRYTHVWVSFLALFYFTLGVGDAYSDPVDRIYGYLMILTSLMLFTGALCYLRNSRQN